MVLDAFVKYLCILLYHNYKVEFIEMEVMKVILIKIIIEKKSN